MDALESATLIPARTGAAPGMNGAECLLRSLVASGVEVCFANPGTSEMHFVSALDRVGGMRPVLGLFEGVVTGAADGYARMSGKPAATLLHLGPGLGNGLANLHNARKAGSPVVNIVGNHATTHLRFDAPLTSDVEAFARTVSHWIAAPRTAGEVGAAAARAVQVARVAPGQIATLILPADTAWNQAGRPAPALPVPAAATVSEGAIADSAAALRRCQAGRGGAALLLRGAALRGPGLRAAGRIAAATGARLICDTFTPRLERGAGRPHVERLPYRPGPAIAFLGGIETLILVGTQAPVAFFAYPDLPGEFTPPGCTPLVLAHPHEDSTSALEALAEALGATRDARGEQHRLPEAPRMDEALTAEAVMRLLGRRLPGQAIISDEVLSGGFPNYPLLDGAAPCDYLQLTGGAIGDGMPLATGAAIACPDRKIVTLQGDGCAMYTLQALWTQAREKLDIVTIIYANRSYGVLREELGQVGAREGTHSLAMLDLHNPELDWRQLARGMGVEAARAETGHDFDDTLAHALAAHGPFLIEAVI